MRSISPEVPLDMVAHIGQLAELSKRYRSKTPSSSPLAQANRELTEIALDLYHRGVPAASIAQAAGVTYRAMARRIANG
jgi:transposase-like protein